MASLLDRPITAASDDGVYAAGTLRQTRAKLLKLNLICITSCRTRTKIWTTDFFFNLNLNNFRSAGKRRARVPIGWSVNSLRALRLDGNPALVRVARVRVLVQVHGRLGWSLLFLGCGRLGS